MSKAIKLCSVILSLCLLLSCVFVKAEAQTAYINGTNVNIRQQATSSSQSLGKVNYDYVTVLDSTTVSGFDYLWYKVQYKEITGYIYGDPEWFVYPAQKPVTPPVSPDSNKTFEESLADFPESYHSCLKALHNKYPNWKFVADKLTMSFDQAVDIQYSGIIKHVEMSQGIAWRSLQKDAYNWDTDTWKIYDGSRWVAASKEVIEYYMDPRNFLDETYIYMFLKQSFDASNQTEQGLAAIINGTFLAGTYEFDAENTLDSKYGGSYSKVIMEAAAQSGVSPYIIASKIITEQGRDGGSSLISGNYSEEFKGYYNFFNWGASGVGDATIIRNGLQTAKDEGWNSRAASIIDGAKKLADGYINKKQDNYYYMAFNLINQVYWHQYESAIYAAKNKASNISKTYSSNYEAALVFNIPVFTSIPDTVATKAEVGDNRYNNYYLTAITADGLSPAFNMFTQSYSLSVSGNTTIYVKVPSKAAVVSAKEISLAPGTNTVKITVQSESGFTNNYTLKVTAQNPCTLSVAVGDKPTAPPESPDNPDTPTPTVKKGDVNGDGVVDEIDLAAVRLYMLGKLDLNSEMALRADINNDALIDEIDLAGIRLYLLGKLSLN